MHFALQICGNNFFLTFFFAFTGHEPYGPYGGAWGAHDHYPMHGGHAFAPHPSSLHAR